MEWSLDNDVQRGSARAAGANKALPPLKLPRATTPPLARQLHADMVIQSQSLLETSSNNADKKAIDSGPTGQSPVATVGPSVPVAAPAPTPAGRYTTIVTLAGVPYKAFRAADALLREIVAQSIADPTGARARRGHPSRPLLVRTTTKIFILHPAPPPSGRIYRGAQVLMLYVSVRGPLVLRRTDLSKFLV